MEYNKVIKNISYNQHEILYNIMRLHNNGNGFECDITYSKGKFYGKYKGVVDGVSQEIEIPQPPYKFDICPQTEDTIKIESFGKLPLEDNSVSSIVVDLPFVITKGPSLNENKKGANVIHKRFSGYENPTDLYKSYSHWLKEAYRVLKEDGILVWKCQNTISGSKFYCTEEFSWMEAQKQGFYVLDRAILLAKNRLCSGKIQKQCHFRNFSCSFWVFQKSKKYKTIDYEGFIK